MNYWIKKLDKTAMLPILNNFFLFNLLSAYSKFSFWQFFFLGFYFDEIFSKIIKFLYFKFFSLTSYFIVDRFFSNWSGIQLFQAFFSIFSNFFYFEHLNFFFFLISLIIVFFYFFIFIILLFFFFV